MEIDFLKNDWNILIVDDSKLNRAVIKKTLTNMSINVDEACDGLEGLEKLEQKKYDLVLLDIIMPNLDGFGFLSQFKNITGQDFIPVILMTGSDDLNSKIKGLQIGADDFLLKPLNEKELTARVLSLLRLKSTHDELYLKNQQIKKELDVAKKVQEFIIPKDFSNITDPVISGRYLPIEDIGGDYFDCYKLPGDKYGFLIADVTGHGIPAALVMTMSKMTFLQNAPNAETSKDLMSLVNGQMRGLLMDSQYITSFYVIYDSKNSTIQFTNAGHNPPLFYRASRDAILALDTNGFFIGISDESEYENKAIKVQKGDRLFLYTDGITEIKKPDGEEYGEKRLAAFIKKNNNIKGDNFCAELLEEVDSFVPLNNRSDDIAFLSIEF